MELVAACGDGILDTSQQNKCEAEEYLLRTYFRKFVYISCREKAG
jgi:hypothetical protein